MHGIDFLAVLLLQLLTYREKRQLPILGHHLKCGMFCFPMSPTNNFHLHVYHEVVVFTLTNTPTSHNIKTCYCFFPWSFVSYKTKIYCLAAPLIKHEFLLCVACPNKYSSADSSSPHCFASRCNGLITAPEARGPLVLRVFFSPSSHNWQQWAIYTLENKHVTQIWDLCFFRHVFRHSFQYTKAQLFIIKDYKAHHHLWRIHNIINKIYLWKNKRCIWMQYEERGHTAELVFDLGCWERCWPWRLQMDPSFGQACRASPTKKQKIRCLK